MRYKANLLLVLSLLYAVSSLAQEAQKATSRLPIVVKWTPTSLLGKYAALQFAGEFYYKYNNSVQLEYGIIFPEINVEGHITQKNGHRIRIEHRNYFERRNRFYWAPELSFTYVNYYTNNRFTDDWETDSLGNIYPQDALFKEVKIRRMIGTINGKMGFQYTFKRVPITFDVYLGLGVRVFQGKFLSYPETGNYVPPIDNLFEVPFDEKVHLVPDGIVGVKLGYKFW